MLENTRTTLSQSYRQRLELNIKICNIYKNYITKCLFFASQGQLPVVAQKRRSLYFYWNCAKGQELRKSQCFFQELIKARDFSLSGKLLWKIEITLSKFSLLWFSSKLKRKFTLTSPEME